MGILVYRDYTAACAAASTLFAAQIIEKPKSVFGFDAGGAPEGVYARLCGMTGSGLLDWSDIVVFTLSEIVSRSVSVPMPRQADFMYEKLFAKVNLRAENICLLDGDSQELDKTCAEFEDAIASLGGMDMLLLGVGKNGELGYNLPSREFAPVTHVSALSGVHPAEQGAQGQALTMGVGTIMNAERIIALVTGEEKAETAERMINGAISPLFPASALQMHRNVTYILDEAAAARL